MIYLPADTSISWWRCVAGIGCGPLPSLDAITLIWDFPPLIGSTYPKLPGLYISECWHLVCYTPWLHNKELFDPHIDLNHIVSTLLSCLSMLQINLIRYFICITNYVSHGHDIVIFTWANLELHCIIHWINPYWAMLSAHIYGIYSFSDLFDLAYPAVSLHKLLPYCLMIHIHFLIYWHFSFPF